MPKDFEFSSNFPNLISEVSFEPKKFVLIISEVKLESWIFVLAFIFEIFREDNEMHASSRLKTI